MSTRRVTRPELELEYVCDGCGACAVSGVYAVSSPRWYLWPRGRDLLHYCPACTPAARAERVSYNLRRANWKTGISP